MFKKLIFIFVCIILPATVFGASASITYFSPSTTVSVGSEAFFRVNPVGFSGTITYSVTDTLAGSSVSSSHINSSGSFVWRPATQDIGTHNITVNLVDPYGNSASAIQQIIVPTIPTVVIQNLFPSSSVNVGQSIFFSTFATGFTNPTYSVSDSVYTSSLMATNMNSSGGFSWTPKSYDVGTHAITVAVTDSVGHNATVVQNITVGIATTTIGLLVPGNTVTTKQTVTFKVTPTGFTNPIYAVSDSVSGSSINSGNLNSLGVFSWTPTTGDLGTHLITIRTSDASGNVSTISQQITVTSPKIIIPAGTPNTTIAVGTLFFFIATSTGLTNPLYTITDSLSGTSISNSNMATSGVFSWTPKNQDVGTHLVKILAMDNSGSSANTEISITVSSQPNTTPPVTPPITTNNGATVTNYIFNKYLSLGSSGPDVSALQTILKQKGLLTGDVTGYYGNLTERAVKDFQASRGLETVGVVGPGTRSALNNLQNTNTTPPTNPPVNPISNPPSNTSKYVFTKPLTMGANSTEVLELQKKLTSMGLYSGPITGTFGSLTRSGVIKLQQKYNLEQVGSIGPATRAVLNN